MESIFDKPYDPKEHEENIYRMWEESGFFDPDNLPGKRKKPFTIIMPPPNSNGALHIGHAVFVTLQDIMIRFKRMQGYKAIWLPGADHAGFETQVVYDKKLEKEGRNRFEMLKTEEGRKQLYDEIFSFTEANKKIMEGQLRRLGASCDWSRKKFTLDPEIIKTVNQTFKKLYDDGLAYREMRIVNFCAKHQTSLSDVETRHENREDKLYYIKYGELEAATTRPETIFGDIAVAVNPKDKRYKKFIGRSVPHPFNGRLLPVIADKLVDSAFGTGVVKITPAHDAADYEMWKNFLGKDRERFRKDVQSHQIINERGRLTVNPLVPEEYRDMKVGDARIKIIDDLKLKNVFIRDEIYPHQVTVCYKCGNILEPLPKIQWFIAMTNRPAGGGLSLRDIAVKALKDKKISFDPKRTEKIYMHWMKNLRDWNISRQIVWGIRIPAWYRGEEVYVGEEAPAGEGWVRDNDVFDTWFSSGQWPYATLGYPEKSDFKNFYPTDVMETAADILFFWVARMIMFGLYRTKKIPFKKVYFHGLVRDKDRQKMSKSKGNVIDPLGVSEQYGTDAVRMALVIGNTAGNDIIISDEKIKGYRNFGNKIWNATRFVLTNVKEIPSSKIKYSKDDEKKLKKLKKIIKETTSDLENFKFHHAGEKLYHFFWHYYADEVIESLKPRLADGDGAAKALIWEFHTTLIALLHPFMPFITEKVWQEMFSRQDLAENLGAKHQLIVKEWPR